MNNIYKYFNYNFIKIIRDNISNNECLDHSKSISKLVFFKEITVLVFVILNFLILYMGLRQVYMISYSNNVLFYILRDNFLMCVGWFVVLSVLPLLTSFMNKKVFKGKYYLLLVLLYLFSNLFNFVMIVYFIASFVNSPILCIFGIVNIIVTLVININIIVEITENNLKRNS